MELLLLIVVIPARHFTQIVISAILTIMAALYAILGTESTLPANVTPAHPYTALNVLNVPISAMVVPSVQPGMA